MLDTATSASMNAAQRSRTSSIAPPTRARPTKTTFDFAANCARTFGTSRRALAKLSSELKCMSRRNCAPETRVENPSHVVNMP